VDENVENSISGTVASFAKFAAPRFAVSACGKEKNEQQKVFLFAMKCGDIRAFSIDSVAFW
jgi:hypothetical protein